MESRNKDAANGLKNLFKSGLSTLLISVYDGEKEYNEFSDMILKSGLSEEKYILRKRYFSEEMDFGITLSNRAGLMENAEYKI